MYDTNMLGANIYILGVNMYILCGNMYNMYSLGANIQFRC